MGANDKLLATFADSQRNGTLNGKTITDIVDAEGRLEGRVALQLHGGMDMTVEFREIFLTRKGE